MKKRCRHPLYRVEFFKIINITGDMINNKLNNKKNSNLLFQKNIDPFILSELTTLLVVLKIVKIIEITIRIEKGIERVPSIQTGI
tara:strand:- start:218 stop:472 length:255 start_codon:yes stop_codon:yes gene_type:complete